jgi:hypothetical protein
MWACACFFFAVGECRDCGGPTQHFGRSVLSGFDICHAAFYFEPDWVTAPQNELSKPKVITNV